MSMVMSLLSDLKKISEYINQNEEKDEDWYESPQQTVKTLEINLASLKEECKSKVKDNELTEEAKAEADAIELNHEDYLQILRLGATGKELQANILLNNMLPQYNRSVVTLEELLAQKNVNALAQRYSKNKLKLPVSKLIQINPGEEDDDYENLNSDGTPKTYRNVTTFAHQLFEQGADRKAIIHFFEELSVLKNPKLLESYMILADTQNRSVEDVIDNENSKSKYKDIKKKLKEVAPALFEKKANAELDINTHTTSVHSSVDKSFVKLAQNYSPEKVKAADDGKSITVERNAEWEDAINTHFEEFKKRMEDINKSDQSRKDFLEKTLPKFEFEDKAKLAEESKELAFKINTALECMNSISEGQIGGNGTMSISTNVIMSLGLTFKEFFVIGYQSLQDTKNLNTPDKPESNLTDYINNIYTGMRGYNIDDFGPEEWKREPTERSRNKCPGGFINQLAEGLKSHKDVEVRVVDDKTLKPLVIKSLPSALGTLSADKNLAKQMSQWRDNNVGVPKQLEDKIIANLKTNTNFTEGLEESEITSFVPKVLKSLDTKELDSVMSKLDIPKKNPDLLYFTFKDGSGYRLYAEQLYEDNPKDFAEALLHLFSKIDPSQQNVKGRAAQEVPIDTLLSSPNKEFVKFCSDNISTKLSKLSKQHLNKMLITTLQNRHGAFTELLLHNHADPNTSEDNEKPIHIAVSTNNVATAELLAKNGADINAKDPLGENPLNKTIGKNYIEMAEMLLKNGADIHAKGGYYDSTPLHRAASKSLKIAKMLIEKGANIHAKDKFGSTPLHSAASADLQILKMLVEKGGDMLAEEVRGRTPLHYIIEENNSEEAKEMGYTIKNNTPELVAELVKKTIQSSPSTKITGFILQAIKADKVPTIEVLIENGADINSQDEDGKTPIDYAIEKNRANILKAIVTKTLKLSPDSRILDTTLQKAVKQGKATIVKTLLKNGANPNLNNTNDSTILHTAVQGNHLETAEVLIRSGANINSKDQKQRTLLHLAILYNFSEMAKMLIENDPDINAKDRNGKTALDYAISRNEFQTAEMLIKKGANINSKYKDGKTALDIAIENNEVGIVSAIVNTTLKISPNSKILNDTLQKAIEQDKAPIVKKLLENGADVYSKYIFSFDRLEHLFDLAKPGSETERFLQEEKKEIDSTKEVILEELVKLTGNKEITEEAKNEAVDNIACSFKLYNSQEQMNETEKNIKNELDRMLSEHKHHSQKNTLSRAIRYLTGYAPDAHRSSLKAARNIHYAKKRIASKNKGNGTGQTR